MSKAGRVDLNHPTLRAVLHAQRSCSPAWPRLGVIVRSDRRNGSNVRQALSAQRGGRRFVLLAPPHAPQIPSPPTITVPPLQLVPRGDPAGSNDVRALSVVAQER